MSESTIKGEIVVNDYRAKHEESQAIAVSPNNPMAMLAIAVSQNADLAKLEKLMDLQQRWEQNEARKAFDAAMAAFKANPPVLEKNKDVDFTSQKGRTHYKHATLDHVSSRIAAAMGPHGLSFRWKVEQANGRIKVTCILAHSAGHFETVEMEGGADNTGNKNEIQQVGSTVTYLERYTLLAITGLAAKEQDTDGTFTNGEISEQVEWIENACDLNELKRLFGNAYKMASDSKDKQAMAIIIEAKNKRKAELEVA